MERNTNYHIIYASDDNFAGILGISITSLFENNRNASNITIVILDSGISIENKQKIEDVCKKYYRSLPHWMDAINIEDKLNISVDVDRGSYSQYSRLFVASHLEDNIKRVLYLDCDVIINKSIEDLWNLDLKGNTIAALMDAFSKYYRRNIELESADIMFNSGVMLIDLDKWKQRNVEQKLVDFIIRHRGKIQQGDQGVLNAILSHKTFCIDPIFNSVTIFYDFTYKEMLLYRKPPFFYSEAEVKKAVNDPVIIHFTTSFLSRRPWEKECKHYYKETWDRYKKISPWADMPERKYHCSGWKRIAIKVYEFFPSQFSARLAGVFQIYGRPIKNRLKNMI